MHFTFILLHWLKVLNVRRLRKNRLPTLCLASRYPPQYKTRPHECVFTTAAHMEASFAAEPVKAAGLNLAEEAAPYHLSYPPLRTTSETSSVRAPRIAWPLFALFFERNMGRGSPPKGCNPTPFLQLISANYVRGFSDSGTAWIQILQILYLLCGDQPAVCFEWKKSDCI